MNKKVGIKHAVDNVPAVENVVLKVEDAAGMIKRHSGHIGFLYKSRQTLICEFQNNFSHRIGRFFHPGIKPFAN